MNFKTLGQKNYNIMTQILTTETSEIMVTKQFSKVILKKKLNLYQVSKTNVCQ